ncbi:Lrp/AsnC family transcriptional regulator [Thermodesulfobacterium hydrogeniphilum]|uniref:siroheme decarboxylase subunit alpha n=1 Tax=Thermodesulfobacterium hydrogeniphilum TaxID=161156 RepID=UPI000570B6DA|nr:Lrp/AsnC family transcriptional regulator [Thermodesulfobacterium hydrogeniphilum]
MDHNKILTAKLKKKFLNFIQKDFPLDKRPFLKIAKKFDLEEKDVIKIIKELQEKKIIRQISAIFNPQFFGHKSGLFAFKVPEERLSEIIEIINSHPGVSHNYLRNHLYNLWFILVALPEKNLLEEAQALAEKCGIKEYLYLPALRIFKISTILNLGDAKSFSNEQGEFVNSQDCNLIFTEFDKKLVKALQEPLKLEKTPFKDIAESLKISEEELFDWIKKMKKKGALRRFGALIKHDKVGYKINVMVAWEVNKDRLESIAKELIKKPFITHCYERKTYPNWQYNLYTMCHFKEEREKEIIPALAKKYEIENYLMLETLKEFKKVRLKLFYDLKKDVT